jgi:hypothetical protein
MITSPKELSLAALWSEYAGEVLAGASAIQRTEMKKAFYSGFLQALMTTTQIAAQMPEKQAVLVLDRLNNEAKGFLGIDL